MLDTAELIDLEVNFDLDLGCQHKWHGSSHPPESASMMVKWACMAGCGASDTSMRCLYAVQRIVAQGFFTCTRCRANTQLRQYPGAYVAVKI